MSRKHHHKNKGNGGGGGQFVNQAEVDRIHREINGIKNTNPNLPHNVSRFNRWNNNPFLDRKTLRDTEDPDAVEYDLRYVDHEEGDDIVETNENHTIPESDEFKDSFQPVDSNWDDDDPTEVCPFVSDDVMITGHPNKFTLSEDFTDVDDDIMRIPHDENDDDDTLPSIMDVCSKLDEVLHPDLYIPPVDHDSEPMNDEVPEVDIIPENDEDESDQDSTSEVDPLNDLSDDDDNFAPEILDSESEDSDLASVDPNMI